MIKMFRICSDNSYNIDRIIRLAAQIVYHLLWFNFRTKNALTINRKKAPTFAMVKLFRCFLKKK